MDRTNPDIPSWGYARRAVTATTTVAVADRGYTIDCTSGTYDVALTAAATLGAGFPFGVYNSGAGTVTINPSGAETIRSPAGSAATLALSQGQGVLILCDGTGFEVIASTGIAPSPGSVISGLTTGRIVDAASPTAIETAASISTDQNLTLTTGSLQLDAQTASRIVTTNGSKQLDTPATITTSQAVALNGTTTVVDGSFSIVGSGDATKTIKFEVDAQTAGDDLTINSGAQTDDRTLTVPVLTGNATLAVLSETQDFTGAKTFSNASGVTISAATGTTLTVSSSANATSKDTGSIVTEGGIGAEKDIVSGTGIYAAQVIQAGSGAASSSVNLIADGGASGANAGGTCYIRNGGATIIGFGNYSAMLGGAYDARPFMYTLVPFNFLDGIRSISPTGGIGYATGAGGTVAQGSGSGKATGVTLNTVCGTITMDGANLNADTTVAFTFTNSAIAATDLVVIQHSSVGTLGAYNFAVTPAGGSATVSVRNVTPGNLAEAIVLRFAIIKAVTA